MIAHSIIRLFVLSHVFLICCPMNTLNHERSRQILCARGYKQFCMANHLDSTDLAEIELTPTEQPSTTFTPPQNESTFTDTRSEFRSFKEHNFAMTGQEPLDERVHTRHGERDRHETVDRKESAGPFEPSRSANPTVLEEMFIRMLTNDDGSNSVQNDAMLSVSHRRLKKLCWKYYPAAKVHCMRRRIKAKFREKCAGYLEDCRRVIYPQDPLGEASKMYQSNIRLSYYNQVVVPMYQQSTTSYTFGNSDSNSNRWYDQNEWIPLG
ncbi:hypothetical protein QR680_000793 [Steinernema hermaphroditum]|uniref:Uncharacterized protein n=1 Tax=Steinernema hermaphroditum TaxID=289476 RepID=A0AA39LEX7_9BILA|nr:hypothetical protein QR680_000793 [Steinernema hermaphroditum]